MNTEKRGFCRATLGYWLVVAVLAWLLFYFGGTAARSCGGSGGGSGSGYAASGSGDGAGSGENGSPTGAGSGAGESLDGKGRSADDPAGRAQSGTAADAPGKAGGQGQTPGGNATPDAPPAVEAEGSTVPPVETAPRAFGFSAGTETSAKPVAGGRKKGFFGVEVVQGGRVIFLVDVSGSMGSTASEGDSRLELLKKELLKVIDEMSRKPAGGSTGSSKSLLEDTASGKFRIANFSCNCELTPGAAEKIWSSKNRNDVQKAQKFIASLKCGGGTNMLSAWQELRKSIAADRITAVYFLSDGVPTDCNDRMLLDYLKRNHPKLIIHTFSMGQSSQLLKDVAAQHRGQYREIQ